jgi:hypothetical protein
MKLEWERLSNNCRRASMGKGQFAQLVWPYPLERRHVLVEIRETVSGNLLRYGGIWPTIREAQEEACYLLEAY